MTAPTLNTKLLTKTLRLVERHEDQIDDQGRVWGQGMWRKLTPAAEHRCHTAMCFAGWTVEAKGATWLVSTTVVGELDVVQRNDLGDLVLLPKRASREQWPVACTLREYANPEPVPSVLEAFAGRLVIHASEYAKVVLGLGDLQAGRLFSAGNDLGDLTALVNEYLASTS